jgi:hypothetical protein
MIEVRAKSAGRPARIAATRAGRMVLNAVVERLARSMGPVATPEATTGSRKG